jgi:hypothetical protein
MRHDRETPVRTVSRFASRTPLAIVGVFRRFFVAIVLVDACLAISTWVLLNRGEKTEALSARAA